jgi:hypothetical protein
VRLFNGKDKTGWKTAPEERDNWRVEDATLTCSGQGISHLYTKRDDFRNFHLRLEGRGESGLIFRSGYGPTFPHDQPKWIPGYTAKLEAYRFGGLTIGEDPLMIRQAAPGIYPDRWYKLEVIAVENHIVIKMNDLTTVDYVDDKQRFTRGHITLEHLGGADTQFHKIEIKELPENKEVSNLPGLGRSMVKPEAPPQATSAPNSKGFDALFNGKDLTGWKVLGGRTDDWAADNGNSLLVAKGKGGGWLMTEAEYANFELRLEYKLAAAGTSAVALRALRQGNSALQGIEIPLLDDSWYRNQKNYPNLRPTERTGSIYNVVPASKDAGKPAGEWNALRLLARGRRITIELNGVQIVDATLDPSKNRAWMPPGLLRTTGQLGLQSHAGRVEFRNIEVKRLWNWHMSFQHQATDGYLEQLIGLRAILAFKKADGTYIVFPNLARGSRQAKIEKDLSKIKGAWNIDSRPKFASDVARLLGLPGAELMVAFFPKELENEMNEKQEQYRTSPESKISDEDPILFVVVRKGGAYTVEGRRRLKTASSSPYGAGWP